MTSTEINRLIEWLRQKGFSDSEIIECIIYLERK